MVYVSHLWPKAYKILSRNFQDILSETFSIVQSNTKSNTSHFYEGSNMTEVSKSLHIIVTRIQLDTIFCHIIQLGKRVTLGQDIPCCNQVHLSEL